MRADGDRAFVRMAVTELRDDDGLVTGYLCVAIDATAAVRSQRALTQAEERWRILMDHLPDTTVVMVEEGTGITVVTGAGVLARRLRDGAGRRLTEIVDAEQPGTAARMLAEAFAGREVAPVHAFVGDLEHEFVASPLPSSSERRQAIVMVRDVSRDRDRERSLTAAKERAERLFDDAPQGIALLGLDGTVAQANPALVALLGVEDLHGRRLSDLSFQRDDPTTKQCGARVFGTVSTEEKAALAREAGADEAILYTKQDFETEVKRLTNSQGVNVVYDSVGKTTFEKSLNCLKPLGYMVLYGQSSGPVAPFDPAILVAKGSLFLTHPSLPHYSADRASLEKRAGDVLGWIASGKLKMRIEFTFPLANVAEAHRSLEGRKTTGKVLLIP